MNETLKIFTDEIEEKALEQINNLIEQEAFKDCKIRIMPDVHAGAGCVIGFTADLHNKVIPNVVGVDIGCGMTWAKLNSKIDLKQLDDIIKAHIPSGMTVRDDILPTTINLENLHCFKQLKNKEQYLEKSLGSLGGGNHFIEVDVDDDENQYLIIHSGSRNLGKQVCEIYQEKATQHCSYEQEMNAEKSAVIKQLTEAGTPRLIESALNEITNKYKGKLKIPKELCYIEGKERDEYLHDMKLCQKWASENRLNMLKIICDNLQVSPTDIKETIHNYISDDNMVRKGAISAHKDEIVLIPMNMRDGCIIAKGKGNDEWNCSAPHGAGRIMSRNQARESLSVDKFKWEMRNVYTTTANETTIDEAPMAYKPMEQIIKYIGDTVDILKIIKPIYNFKASE